MNIQTSNGRVAVRQLADQIEHIEALADTRDIDAIRREGFEAMRYASMRAAQARIERILVNFSAAEQIEISDAAMRRCDEKQLDRVEYFDRMKARFAASMN